MSNNKAGPFLPQGFPLPNHPLPSRDTVLALQGFTARDKRAGGHQFRGAKGQKLLPPGPAPPRAHREGAGEMLL